MLAKVQPAAVVEGVAVLPLQHLCRTVGFLRGTDAVNPLHVNPAELPEPAAHDGTDFSEVRGQPAAMRAIEVAVAGGHNLLMLGPPGAGKTMLAQRIPTIMPAMSPAESLQTSLIYSVMGLLPPGQALLRSRPFRAPHHTITDTGVAASVAGQGEGGNDRDRPLRHGLTGGETLIRTLWGATTFGMNRWPDEKLSIAQVNIV